MHEAVHAYDDHRNYFIAPWNYFNPSKSSGEGIAHVGELYATDQETLQGLRRVLQFERNVKERKYSSELEIHYDFYSMLLQERLFQLDRDKLGSVTYGDWFWQSSRKLTQEDFKNFEDLFGVRINATVAVFYFNELLRSQGYKGNLVVPTKEFQSEVHTRYWWHKETHDPFRWLEEDLAKKRVQEYSEYLEDERRRQ